MATQTFDDTLKRFEVMEKAKQEKILLMKANAAKKIETDKRATMAPIKTGNRVPLAERTQQILEEKEQKQAALKKNLEKEKMNKEMDECTFKPSIINRQTAKQNSENQQPAGGTRIDAMLKWAEDKNRKLAEIALDKDLKMAACQSSLSNTSGTKKRVNVKEIEKSTDRLYSQRMIMEKKRLDMQAKEAENLKFKPEINKKSIELAEKRKTKYHEAEETLVESIQETQIIADIKISDGNEKSVEKIVKTSAPFKKPKQTATPDIPRKKPVEPAIINSKLKADPPINKASRSESKSLEKKNSDKKNYFAQDDTAEYIEMERTIDKAVNLFNMDRRKSKEKPPIKEKPIESEDVVNQLKHLCDDIDNLMR